MPYEPSPVSDDSHEKFSRQRGSSSRVSGGPSISSSVNASPRRDEPRGIARYFHPMIRPVNGPPQALVARAQSRPGSPASTPRAMAGPSSQARPSLVRTGSRIAVVINSSSQHQTSPPTSGHASEDSLEGLVTSDLTPRLPKLSTTLPTKTTPQDRSSATSTPRGRPPSTATTARAKATPTVPRPSTSTRAPTTETPATQPLKRRGRPVGWRHGMGGYSDKSSFPGGPSVPQSTKKATGPPKKRGRPGRPGVNPTRAIWEKLRPKYVPFLCEWNGCPAELQNIDTLRRHVQLVHGREGILSCRWGKCNDAQRERFGSRAEFERHVEDAHLVPFTWHVGDGPRNSLMEYKVKTADEAADDLPDYLFDEDGNQVTPSVLLQEFENEEEKKERRRRLRRLLLERDAHAPAEEPDEDMVVDDGVNDFEK